MRRTSKPVAFNLFHAAIHFATQFNLTIPFRKFPVRHMKCNCVCTIENHNGYKITHDITVFNQDSFVKESVCYGTTWNKTPHFWCHDKASCRQISDAICCSNSELVKFVTRYVWCVVLITTFSDRATVNAHYTNF